MHTTKKLLCGLLLAISTCTLCAQTLKIHYALTTAASGDTVITDETGNGYDGLLKGSATISSRTYKGVTLPVVKLGAFKGYIDMGEKTGALIASLKDYTISIKMYIPGTLNALTTAGNYFWSFAGSEDIAANGKGYMGLSGYKTTFAASLTNATEAGTATPDKTAALSQWATVTLVQQDYHVRFYLNGVLAGSGESPIRPCDLGATRFNSIGRPLTATESYLKYSDICEFSLYDGALTSTQVAALCGISSTEDRCTLKLDYNFEGTADAAGGVEGSLQNGAVLERINSIPVLNLGTGNGYFDMGEEAGNVIAALDSFTIATYLYLPESTNFANAGNFVYTFAGSNNIGSNPAGYLFFGANESRYSITPSNYKQENTLSMKQNFATGSWRHLAYRQHGSIGSFYIDGEWVMSDSVKMNPRTLGKTTCNYLGRSCYSNDSYLSGAMYAHFCVYDGALPDQEIYSLSTHLDDLNSVLYMEQLQAAGESLVLEGIDKVTADLTLPASAGSNISITWSSSNEKVLAADGSITRPAQGEADAVVTLTATLHKKKYSLTKDFTVTVLSKKDGPGSVKLDLEQVSLSGDLDNLKSDLYLPSATCEGSVLLWKSSNPDFLTNSGKLQKLSPKGAGKQPVTLTVTACKQGYSESRDFAVQIAEDDELSAYLFTYFTGNRQSQEQICYAVSMDGYNYVPLNEGNPIIASDTISIKKAVRDPHILRGEDGSTFYMVATDMKSSDGWSSNDGLVLMKSNDLVNWTHTAIDFPTAWPDLFDRNDLTQVWAPQTIYDPEAGKYMVYYAIGMKSQAHYIIWYSYANDDFTELTRPQILFDFGANTIDADIVYSDSLYHIFFKTEGNGNGIQKATSPSLHGPWTPTYTYLQQTSVSVEGSGVFKLINSNNWVLMYDCYTSGYYQFCSSPDLENFTWVCNTTTSGTFTPRHGTVMAITADEARRLVAKWPSSALKGTPLGAKNLFVRQDKVEISTTANTIVLPLRYGADLSKFDPQLYGYAGTQVSPAGEQDFTQGAVTYTFTMPGSTAATYRVTARISVNPILPDFHADPEVLYSKKTGRFYTYTTTDGLSGWAGTYYECYSSPNLVDWTYEVRALDLATSQVSWASGNAWAPAIEEKMMANGDYKYFLYFSGNAGSNKQIGVATATSPTGPFTDSGASIVSTSPTGSGQQIDVDVFTDPVSGKSYLYWGNGYMAVAELEESMTALKAGTTQVITPSGGTLATYAYREAPYVFYRNGLYYFMWSVDDTGAANYHVAYGTSTSPTGPIKVAASPIVIIQNPDEQIYGTAHNSILQIPGRDEWYIVYHRINKNYLSNGPGYHRETCIDRLYFNEDGTIKQVTPTHQGVEPVDVTDVVTTVKTLTLDSGEKKQVVDTVYYSLNGMYMGHNAPTGRKGFYIKKDTMNDGSVCVTKLLK